MLYLYAKCSKLMDSTEILRKNIYSGETLDKCSLILTKICTVLTSPYHNKNCHVYLIRAKADGYLTFWLDKSL